jgi:hypothetical protein
MEGNWCDPINCQLSVVGWELSSAREDVKREPEVREAEVSALPEAVVRERFMKV